MRFIDIEETIKKRKSVRTYDGRPLTDGDRSKLEAVIEEVCSSESPFPGKMKITILDAGSSAETEKLGTYGVIKGANTFLCVTAEKTEGVMEAVGYNFEKLVLAATEMGLGTCWMAGTFNRNSFKNALEIGENEIFPIISPIGYEAEKTSFMGNLFRTFSKAGSRKAFGEVFRNGDFANEQTEDEAGEYAFPLEMVRLAPSAVNRQPWRVVMKDGNFHFYKENIAGGKVSLDLQSLDVAIGACHFHLAAESGGLAGKFVKEKPELEAPAGMEYMFTWKTE